MPRTYTNVKKRNLSARSAKEGWKKRTKRASSKMNLMWENHLNNICELFANLYEEQQLVDATLACEGGLLRVHKLVLSAYSPYFSEIFRDNPCKHPTLVLHRVRLPNMIKLLEYMYKGAVTIEPECLDEVLQLAADLGVRGFQDFLRVPKEEDIKIDEDQLQIDALSEEEPNTSSHTEMELSSTASGPFSDVNSRSIQGRSETCLLSHKKKYISMMQGNGVVRKDESPATALDDSGEDVAKTSYASKAIAPTSSLPPATIPIAADAGTGDTQQPMQPEVLTTTALSSSCATLTLFSCAACRRQFKSRKDLQKHKRVHKDKTFSCEFCRKLFSRASHLIRHRRVHTGERPFVCDVCGRDFARQDKLKLHVRAAHGQANRLLSPSDDCDVDGDDNRIGTVEVSEMSTDGNCSEYEPMEHVTLDNIISAEKRKRGRPRKHPVAVVKPKRSRGRPRKEPIQLIPIPLPEQQQEQHQHEAFESAPNYGGDIGYLTLPIEPLVEITTSGNAEGDDTGGGSRRLNSQRGVVSENDECSMR